MQLLQAHGWFGIFVVMTLTKDEDERGRTVATVTVRLRPLVGWCSAEGGFQPLYYDELTGRLETGSKLLHDRVSRDSSEYWMGDFCEIAPPLTKSLFRAELFARSDYWLEQGARYSFQLSESAKKLFTDHMIPVPEE